MKGQMKDIAEKIIEMLEGELGIKLPKKGFLAGQSVAEAYFRIMDIPIKTRIKDVDLFTSSKEGLKDYYDEKDLKTNFIIQADGKTKILMKESSYGMTNMVNEGRLIIHDVLEKDRLNIVITNQRDIFTDENKNDKNKYYSYEKHILDSFDLNSVMIGVNLRSRKLFKTEEFEEFLTTKQIKIENFCSPVPSLARLIEKEETSEGIYANIDYEAQLSLSKLSFYKEKNIYSSHRGMYMSLDRYNSFSLKTKETIENYFNIENMSVRSSLDFETDEHFKLVKFKLKTQKMNKETRKKVLMLKESFNKNDVTFESISRSFLTNLLKKEFHSLVKEKVFLNKNTFNLLMLYNIKKDIFKEKNNDLIALCRHMMFTRGVIGDFEVKDIARKIREFEKSDNAHIIGMAETGEIPYDFVMNKDLSIIEKEIEDYIKEATKNYNYSLPEKMLEDKTYKIEQIKTLPTLIKLGKDMKHCVGGYWGVVKKGRSLIFDIKGDLNKKERWTLELRVSTKGASRNRYNLFYDERYETNSKDKDSEYEYILSQVRGKFNEPPPSKINTLSNRLAKTINQGVSQDFFPN